MAYVRTNVSMPDWLMQQYKDSELSKKVRLSEILQEALRERLGVDRKGQIDLITCARCLAAVPRHQQIPHEEWHERNRLT